MMQGMLIAMSPNARYAVNIIINSAVYNYVAGISKIPGYQAGRTDVTFLVQTSVGSLSTGAAAFEVDTSWNPTDTVTIVVSSGASIIGAGGAGGSSESNGPGGNGGPGLLLNTSTIVKVNNLGTIAGGGGGGGASCFYRY